MSISQLSLLMGVLLVVAILVYNMLQERKFRKDVEDAFEDRKTDPLMPDTPPADDLDTPAWARDASRTPSASPPSPSPPPPVIEERREPVLNPPPIEAPAAPSPILDPPLPSPAKETLPPPSESAGAMPPADWCDSSIDAVVRVDFNAPLDREDLMRAFATMQAQLRLPLRAYAQLLNGRWQGVDTLSGGEFHRLCFALQLVDRHGPVTKAELDSLQNSVMGLCKLRKGEAVMPNLTEAASQAQALDEFCAQLDLQLALNVLNATEGAFAGTKIRGLAEAAGMKLADSGEFQAFDEDGNFLFAIANMGEAFTTDNLRTLQTHGLTFLLDVPHVLDGKSAFERMLATAKQFATALGGNLVNAQRATMTDAMVEGIRKKIMEIHEQMKIAGIPAGGTRALRLFS